jgi:peptide/nickel transport system ATP-binding protein
VLNLLLDLKRDFGLTYLFISHDLNVVRFMCDRVMVMYLGKVAEIGSRDAIFDDTKHPYSSALLASMPKIDPSERTVEPPLVGDPPNPIDPPSGCRFHTRCNFAEPVCSTKVPPLFGQTADHSAACLMSLPGSGHSRAPVPMEA